VLLINGATGQHVKYAKKVPLMRICYCYRGP